MSVKIIADSAADLTIEQYKSFNIDMLPLTVQSDEGEFEDGIEIKPKTVYKQMREGKILKTSQVTPQAFKHIFTQYARQNQPFIYLAFSSELSGTYQTGKMMEQEVKETYPHAQFYCIDSKCASLGYGLVARFAAELAEKESDIEIIAEKIKTHAKHMEHIFTVADLEYLKRGGRLSKAAAFFGTMLNIKPILHVEDGKLIPIEKIRGRKKVLKRILKIMEERGTNLENQIVGISHGDDFETAEQLANMIKEKFNPKEVVIEMVGSVIGAHSGPGTIALFFQNENRI